jgi:hypothetical protein
VGEDEPVAIGLCIRERTIHLIDSDEARPNDREVRLGNSCEGQYRPRNGNNCGRTHLLLLGFCCSQAIRLGPADDQNV